MSEVLSGALVVTVVPVSSSSPLIVMSEDLLSDSDWEIVEPQSFSFSRKRQAVCVENQEDMNYDGTPVKHRQHPEGRFCRQRRSRACSRQLRPCSCKRSWRVRKAAVVDG